MRTPRRKPPKGHCRPVAGRPIPWAPHTFPRQWELEQTKIKSTTKKSARERARWAAVVAGRLFPQLDEGGRAVLEVIIDAAGDQMNDVTMSAAQILARLQSDPDERRSISWVHRRLLDLRELGLLERKHNMKTEHGKLRQTANTYRVTIPAAVQAEMDAQSPEAAQQYRTHARRRPTHRGRVTVPETVTPPLWQPEHVDAVAPGENYAEARRKLGKP